MDPTQDISEQIDRIALTKGLTFTVDANTVSGIGAVGATGTSWSQDYNVSSQNIYQPTTTSAGTFTWNGTSAVPNTSPWVTMTPGVTLTSPNTAPWIVSDGTTGNKSAKISLQGENADIEINGKSMAQWMKKVEQQLNILTPNPELEKEWDELRRLGERYRRLEKKCQEKAEVWKKLSAKESK